MTSDVVGRASHGHHAVLPHDDAHHLVAAFALLLLERGAHTTEDLSAHLARLQVVRGRIERGGLAGLIDDLEETGLIVRQEGPARSAIAYALTPAGKAVVADWVAVMRERRRLSRTFLALYDRTDE